MVWIPSGALIAGSAPDAYPRLADEEIPGEQVILKGFYIDVFPHPNEEGAIPLTNVTQAEARGLCETQGKRLCTELEWERACKGPDGDRYPTGRDWDPSCAKEPRKCETGFGVLALGTAGREWTKSVLVGEKQEPLAVVRGAAADAEAGEHRCGARRGLDAETKEANIGFRCCSGPPNARKVPEPATLPAYRKHALSGPKLAALLKQHEVTRGLEKGLVFFSEPEAAETVVARGPGDRKGFSFTVTPLLWSPVPGAEYLILTARSGENTSFVLAYYVLGDDKYRLAASFVMKDEPGPVALAYTADIRPRLHFSTCWGCLGETGKILFRRPERVAIVAP